MQYIYNLHTNTAHSCTRDPVLVYTPWIEKVDDDDDYDVFDDYHNKVKSIPYPPCASNLIIINLNN